MTRFTPSITFIAALSCTVVFFTGCASQAHRQHIPSEVNTDAPIVGRPTLGLPIYLPDTDTSVVPFTIDRPKRWLEDADRFDASFDSSRADTLRYAKSSAAYAPTIHRETESIGYTQSVRWHNAVIQPKQGQAQLVLDKKGIISRFEIVGHWIEDERENSDDEKTYTFMPKAVLFLTTQEDTNNDRQLTGKDANVLLAADPSGNGLHPITPAGTQVQSTRYNAQRNLIIIMVTADTNGDGLFTEADSSAPYTYTPGTQGMAKPLIDPAKALEAQRLLK